MATCSIAAYAKRHGVSKQAAGKWKTRGVLAFSGDMVDVEASDRRMRDAGLGLFKAGQPVDGASEPVDDQAIPVDAFDETAVDTANLGGIDEFLAGLNAGHYRSQVDAQRIKENVLAARHLMNLRKEAGELIEVDRAAAQFFKLAREARDAWMTWPARVGPLLAADLGADTAAVVEALNRYVQEQLERIGEKEPDFDEE
ncbi:hypothetical protein [Novosphingobium sp. FSW06-99]|uniref:hypothetical protein n=1 Tax=Novosphingobium sp. FSW06-99 TaxID=1739113 RepID=UPI00076D6B82|nr:hypothetical protein [Novosphingobium sp. FSW06-99]KUR80769.1 hypothetical protein AQZ49_01710 [Novosphingobium sp. FSW06-99]